MIVDMPREAKVGGGVWHEYILLSKKKKKKIGSAGGCKQDWRCSATVGHGMKFAD